MIRKQLERLFPSLLIRRANRYSAQLEEDTGWRLKIKEGEDGFMFFLIDPYGDGDDLNSDWWSDLDQAIFDLSDCPTHYFYYD